MILVIDDERDFDDADIGDSIVYAMDYNYKDDMKKKAHRLFYQWHGNGY